MKRFGLALAMAFCVALVGCGDAKDKVEGVKGAAKEGVENVTEKAKGGDVKGAVDAGKEGVEKTVEAAK